MRAEGGIVDRAFWRPYAELRASTRSIVRFDARPSHGFKQAPALSRRRSLRPRARSAADAARASATPMRRLTKTPACRTDAGRLPGTRERLGHAVEARCARASTPP